MANTECVSHHRKEASRQSVTLSQRGAYIIQVTEVLCSLQQAVAKPNALLFATASHREVTTIVSWSFVEVPTTQPLFALFPPCPEDPPNPKMKLDLRSTRNG